MSNEEIVNLIQQGTDIRENEELLYKQNVKFIEMIIKRWTGMNKNDSDFDDYRQQGFIGLITAASKYDASFEVKFLTYAEHWIRQSIFKYNENCGSVVRVPSYLIHRIRKYKGFEKTYKLANNRYPTDEECCRFLNISIRGLEVIKKTIRQIQMVSLDSYVGSSEDNSELIDYISSNENIEDAVTYSVYLKDLHQVLNCAMEVLTDKEKEIVKSSFYLRHTYDMLSEIYKCSRQNIHDIKTKAFYKILHSKYRKELETFMYEGFIYCEENDCRYKKIEAEDSEFLI